MNPPRPIRSCTLCRQRKIKCDRQQPCGNCVRAESQCVYPAGLGRAPKRPRKAVEARLLAQLSRLESMVKRMEGESPETGVSTAVDAVDERKPEVAQRFGRLVIDDMHSCYVSSAPWTQLGDEIEELRDLLHHPSSDEDEDQPPVSAPEGPGLNGAIMGFRALAHSLYPYHPQVPHAVALFEIFKTNVAPVVCVFHMPTLERMFWDAIASMDTVDKNVEALLFAIYYTAVISLDPEQCLNVLGIPRPSALETYRFAIEQATARADLLNTQNLILLQATVLFLTALRNEDDSRTVWSLTALIYHIAQAMGLHRDGETFGLRPLETELRRRLWWHICLLDNRSTDYHGSQPIVDESGFDTKMPLNINDVDLTAEMTQPPAEREGATEMTFCLIRCQAVRVVWKVGYMAPATKQESADDERPGSLDREALAEDFEHRIHDRYLKHCDPTVPLLRLSSTVARIITLRMSMAVLSPRRLTDKNVRDQLFRGSVEILELSTSLLTGEDIQRWAWHCKTHLQWYYVAFLLAEICWRPPSPECDHAWQCVSVVYDRWNMMETEKKGTLWRPIRRLMARARYVREIRRTSAHPAGTAHRWRSAAESSTPTPTGIDSSSSPEAGIPNLATVEPQEVPIYGDGLNLTPNSDPLMEMLPANDGLFDASAMRIFGLMSETNGVPWAAGYIPDLDIPCNIQSPNWFTG
ncbi:hypothetical protein BJX76DRAFT_339132 [Aspergillus varians]